MASSTCCGSRGVEVLGACYSLPSGTGKSANVFMQMF